MLVSLVKTRLGAWNIALALDREDSETRNFYFRTLARYIPGGCGVCEARWFVVTFIYCTLGTLLFVPSEEKIVNLVM